jgi:AmiR/NasT family two-component response regulator
VAVHRVLAGDVAAHVDDGRGVADELLDRAADPRVEVLQQQTALVSRVVIEQAKGALAQLRQVSVDEAFELMRSFARRNGRTLSAVAQAVLSDDRSAVAALTGE